LICDGFGTHETLEILEFCFENNILLYRLPSHISHKLQPYNIATFAPLKAAYRDQVDRLEQGGINTIGKEHFTSLYSPARERAFTLKNIKAGFAASGLFPFNPDRVLRSMPAPLAEPAIPRADEVQVGSCRQDIEPQTQKCAKGFQQYGATNILQADRIQFLTTINNEAKVRRSTKSLVLGKAKVMSYEDLEEARAKRLVKESTQAAKGKGKRGRKSKSSQPEPEEDTAETARHARKRKSAELKAPEPANKMARMSNVPGKPASALVMQASRTQIADDEIEPEQWRAPVAQMY